MAILVQQQRRGMGLAGMITFLVILVILGFAVYYLFFAPTPGFDVIIPAPLERTQTISTFSLDPSTVFDSPAFKSLKKITGAQNSGSFGRDNPFLQ